MAGVSLRGIPTLGRPLTLADTLQESRMGGFLADFEQAMVENPMESLDRMSALDEAGGTRLTDEYQAYIREGNTRPETVERFRQKRNPSLTFDEARTIVADRGLSEHLTIPKDGIATNALDLLMTWKDQELIRKEKRAAAPQDLAQMGLGLLAGISAGVLDPASLTAAMLPLGGPARFLQAATRGGRAARGAAAGIAAGTVESAAFEPFIYRSMQAQQADYDLTDSAMNIAFGAAFGGILGGIGGAIRRGVDGGPELALDAEAPANRPIPPEVQRAATVQGMEAVAEGRPVRAVEVVALAAENDPRTARAVQEAVNPAGTAIDTVMAGRGGSMVADVGEVNFNSPDGPAGETAPPQVEVLAGEIKRLRQAATAPPKRESLNNFIADRGGITPDDPLAVNLKDATGQKRQRPGFYSRKGQGLDRMREAAAEAGYFGKGRDPQSVPADEFIDAVRKESDGERVFPPERMAEFEGDAKAYADMERALDNEGISWDEAVKDPEGTAQRLMDADAEVQAQMAGAADAARNSDDVPEWANQESQNWSTAADQAPDAMDDNAFTSVADQKLEQAMATWRALVESGRIGELEDNALTREIEALEAEARPQMAGIKQAMTCLLGTGAN